MTKNFFNGLVLGCGIGVFLASRMFKELMGRIPPLGRDAVSALKDGRRMAS